MSPQVTSTYNATPSWAGFLANGKTFAKVQGDITVPTITCTANGAESLFWVGFDGYNPINSAHNTVEQDGVGAKCVGSTPSYFAWWEMYNPTNGTLHQVASSTLLVKPGNRVAAIVSAESVKGSNGKVQTEYLMQLDNTTTKQKTFATEQPCYAGYTCSHTTAEWIAERYNNGNNTYPLLAKWGYNSQLFAYAEATTTTDSTLEPVSAFDSVSLNMLDSGDNFIADGQPLNSGGTSFGVEWLASK